MTNHPRIQRKQAQFHSDLGMLIASILMCLGIILGGIGLIQEASADPQPQVTSFQGREQTQFQKVVYDLPQHTTVIACYHAATNTIVPRREGGEEGKACHLGPGYNAIQLPPQWHFPKWREFWSEGGVINRLVIVNFESSFDPEKQNAHAKGYVQTLKKYNIAPDVTTQLRWMANREINNSNKQCSQFLTSYYPRAGVEGGQGAYISCISVVHYGVYNFKPRSYFETEKQFQFNEKHTRIGNFYSKRTVLVRQFYEDYFSNY